METCQVGWNINTNIDFWCIISVKQFLTKQRIPNMKEVIANFLGTFKQFTINGKSVPCDPSKNQKITVCIDGVEVLSLNDRMINIVVDARDIHALTATNGDIQCTAQFVQSTQTTNGDITISGNVDTATTTNGDIKASQITQAKTVCGDIIRH